MAAAAERTLGEQIRGGVVITPLPAGADGPAPCLSRVFETMVGGHPVPTAGSEEAGRRALTIARSLASDEVLLVLLSGGASAVMVAPSPGVSLEDKRQTTARLLRAGADIHALNTVRKHLSAIKGGQLATAAPGACVTLAISDVVGDDLSVVGSGPTVADSSTFASALEKLRKFGGVEVYPKAVVARLTAGTRDELPETPKPGDSSIGRSAARVIGGRKDAMTGASAKAQALGYQVIQIDEPVVGEARVAAAQHLAFALLKARASGRPACVISSGETTVHVKGAGKGGRNQEFALASADALASAGTAAVGASVGTDGVDGPTDAAGAIVDSTTIERIRAAGLPDPAHYLEQNNTYELFSRLGDLINTGPTGTNVGDLQVLLLS